MYLYLSRKNLLFIVAVICGLVFIYKHVIRINNGGNLISHKRAVVQVRHGVSIVEKSSKKMMMVMESKDKIGKLEASITKHGKSCPTIVRPNESQIKYQNGYWQMSKEGSTEIYVLSAFYDDRPIVGLLPVIRAHVVSNVKEKVYCHVWYSGYDHPYVTTAIVTSTGRGEKIGSIRYKQDLYSCPLIVSYPLPSHLSFTTSSCHNSSIYLELTVPIRSDWQHEFGICVAISFGMIPIPEFVEWMEINRLLGVSEINIYDGNISSNMSKVFDYYVNKGLLRVYSMPPPVMDFSVKGVKLSSPASLNDCMLRNMYRYRYVVIIDFDEVIVPRQQLNYTDLLKAIDKQQRLPHSSPSYTFRNAYFFSQFPEDTSQPPYLKTMRRRYRIQPSRFLFAPKSFIDPRSCLSVFNHYCWKRFPLPDKRWTIDVNTSLALSHHYRSCSLGKSKCSSLEGERTQDDVLLRYKPVLDINVREALKNLRYNITVR